MKWLKKAKFPFLNAANQSALGLMISITGLETDNRSNKGGFFVAYFWRKKVLFSFKKLFYKIPLLQASNLFHSFSLRMAGSNPR